MSRKDDPTKPTVILGRDVRSILEGARAISLRGEDRADSNVESTSSFFYDPPALGLKSSQQLNVDWSKFQNHTFFNSAEVNVNVAFDQIINGFPFDGSRRDFETFFEKLTGYEKWVYDQFPKNVGYLMFSGTQAGEDTDGTLGTWISVNDYAGGAIPELSKNKSGRGVLDPVTNSFTIELQLFVPTTTNGTQVICQKMSGTQQGINMMLLPTSSTTVCDVLFSVISGSNCLVASASLTKGEFTNLAATFNRTNGINRLEIYKNAVLTTVTPESVNVLGMDIRARPFIIGSGSEVQLGSTTYTPDQTLSGAIDELRFFHSVRTKSQLEKNAQKAIFASPELKLYFKFNEPSGTLGSTTTDSLNQIVLDSSGNSLHSYISTAGAALDVRATGSIDVPMVYEKLSLSPILFPAFETVVDLNELLLVSATLYDQANPNLVSKLVPAHYFLEGQDQDGLDTEGGTLGEGYTGDGTPGSGKLGSTQLLLTFLYTWGKFFDELKLFVDSFSTLNYVDYASTGTAPDHFLPTLLKQYGFNVPPFFLDASIEQFIDAENISPVISTEEYSLQYIQNQILRRVLTNMLEIIRSKGTLHSIKAFMRCVGIDPDNSFRIREYGGPTKQSLLHARESKSEPGFLLDFDSGGLLVSPFLSSSRVEVGFPEAVGTMTHKSLFGPHGVSDNLADGLFSSGSWTYEAVYKWPITRGVSDFTQSLARLITGGDFGSDFCTFNLVAITSSLGGDPYGPRVRLYGRPTEGLGLELAPLLTLELSGCNIFDGSKWHISFGRTRSDAFGSSVSSSYFLRAATSEYGEIKKHWVTSSYFLSEGTSPPASSTLGSILPTTNASGSFLAIGYLPFTPSTLFLNDTSYVPDEARATSFNGQLARLRFWTKDLSEAEWLEHVRNYKSLGVADPTKNFSFVTTRSGSWEKLRLDASMDQDTRDADSSGNIRLFDYSQGNYHLQGSNFVASTRVISSSLWSYSFISPSFDEAVTNDKIRIRSFQNINYVNSNHYAEVAPVYRINPSETPTDDTRMSIEFSIIDALNRDIINIFSTFESLDNILGNPELIFSQDYPGLEVLRNVYFNRLTDKINIKSFFEFFRWFDTSIGSFIEQLIPRKTRFFGTNFVIESHMLERPKMEYSYNDIYLTEANRHNMKDTLLLQQIVGTLKRY
jgi:hypothetical protein